MHDLFSPDGIAAWHAHLNTSSRFMDAAGTWEGALLLVAGDPGASGPATWVRIAEGRCLEARPGVPADREQAEFILAAAPETWQGLVAASTTLVTEVMSGRLRLVKGNAMRLIPHAKLATELLQAAGG